MNFLDLCCSSIFDPLMLFLNSWPSCTTPQLFSLLCSFAVVLLFFFFHLCSFVVVNVAPLLSPLFIRNNNYCSSFLSFVHSHQQLLVLLFCVLCSFLSVTTNVLRLFPLFSFIRSFSLAIVIAFIFCPLFILTNKCFFFFYLLCSISLVVIVVLFFLICSFSLVATTPFLFPLIHPLQLFFSSCSFLTTLLLLLFLILLVIFNPTPYCSLSCNYISLNIKPPPSHLSNFNYVYKVLLRILQLLF